VKPFLTKPGEEGAFEVARWLMEQRGAARGAGEGGHLAQQGACLGGARQDLLQAQMLSRTQLAVEIARYEKF
jgi:hypothetical protein